MFRITGVHKFRPIMFTNQEGCSIVHNLSGFYCSEFCLFPNCQQSPMVLWVKQVCEVATSEQDSATHLDSGVLASIGMVAQKNVVSENHEENFCTNKGPGFLASVI